MRVLPHHQDTGGFFIAVLEKKDWLPWQRKQKRARQPTATETKAATTVDDTEAGGHDIDVPKLKDLASKAAASVKPPEENLSSTGGSASIDPAESEDTNSGVNTSERTTCTLNSMKPEGSGENVPLDEEGKETMSGDGQERPSKTLLGR